jgi:pyruvate/2-oxoglutarate dehydrogenase complex dihydrolipoamide acyltransferase (E2) component
MPITIEMPKLSDTMTEGTLVRWIKKVGDDVEVGDVLAEVETDKATMEMEAFDEGVLAEIYVQDGNKVEVGQKLAILLGKGEKTDSGAPKSVPENKTAVEKKENKTAAPPPKETIDTEEPARTQGQHDSESAPTEAAPSDRIKASPLAKKIAAEKGVDLGSLHGSSSPHAIPRAFFSHSSSFSRLYESFGSKSATFPINPQAPHVVTVSLSQTTRPPQVDSASGTHVTATVRFAVAPHFGQRSGDCCLFSSPLAPIIRAPLRTGSQTAASPTWCSAPSTISPCVPNKLE